MSTHSSPARGSLAAITLFLLTIDAALAQATPQLPTTVITPARQTQAIDDALVSTWTSLSEADPGAAAAEALANRATPLTDAISGAATAVDDLSTNLAGVQANADATIDSIRNILLIAAIALSILFVWVLALNIALWVLGRAWEHETV